jgi:hypothetical protein
MSIANVQIINSLRDIRLFKLDKERILGVSCDSSGGIGPKTADLVKASGNMVGKFVARVALMEALAVGGTPFCASVALAVEPKPTGARIIEGVRNELRHVCPKLLIMLQSTEKNFHVKQTGAGVTLLSLIPRQDLRIKKCRVGDVVLAVGIPSVGHRVLVGEREHSLADPKDIIRLLKNPNVHEMIPVGSRGILHEAQTMASDSKLKFKLNAENGLDVRKSAGPATVILCAIPEEAAKLLMVSFSKPTRLVGVLH